MSASITISLNAVRLYAEHGWHEEEALTGNEFELDIIIRYTPNATLITNIDQTINYAAVYKVAREVFSSREKLLETVAMKIAGALQVHFPTIETVEVRIKKLSVPITGFEGDVSVSYSRSFK